MPRWMFWMALTLASWGVWAVLPEFLAESVDPAHSQALSTLGLAPILFALWRMPEESAGRDRRLGIMLAIAAGIASSLGNIAYFRALEFAKAATVAPLTAMSPAVTIILAAMLLKERVTLLQWIGMGCSFVAILLFNAADEAQLSSDGIVYALIPLVLWGVTLLLQKMSTDRISARTSALWFLATFVPLAVIILAWNPLTGSLSARTWAVEAAIGFTLGFGNLTIMWALASGGKASVVAPLSGLYPLVSIPIAIVFLHQRLEPREWAGIAMALCAVWLLSTQADSPAIGAIAAPADD